MSFTDEQIRPIAEKFRIMYDELGFHLTDEEIWFLAIEHLEIKNQIAVMADG